jgi:hypothetical protein
MAFTINPVPLNVILDAHEVVVASHGSGRDPFMAIAAALAKKHDHDQLTNAVMRLRALAEIVQQTDKSSWVMTLRGKDYKLINEAALRAAARTPLVERRRKLRFDPKQFAKIALEESEAEGSA